MSYPISAPVNFSADGSVSLTLTDTTATTVWDVSTQPSASSIIIGTNAVSSPNVLQLYKDGVSPYNDPSGAAQAPRFRLVRGSNYVNLDTDSGLSQNYT